jgi:TolB protein
MTSTRSITSLIAIAAIGAVTLFADSRTAAPQQTIIDVSMINKPGYPPRLAVPPFVVLTADAETQQAAKTLTEVLFNDLAFEREFYLIDQATIAGIPSAQTIDALPFDRWTELKAEFVVLGSVQRSPKGGLEVAIRVISIPEKAQRFGGLYEGAGTLARKVAHVASDEIHKQLRGVDGVAQTRIVFSSTRDAERYGKTIQDRTAQEIYMMDYDGANQRRITADKSLNLGPAWCPDGTCIAYTSYSPDAPDIVIRNLYKIGESRPTRGGDRAQNFFPAFSPDGSKIAFASARNGAAMDIYVVNRDGSDTRRLTNHPGSDSAPAWSPKGNQIAFTSDRSGSNQLYVMDPDGGAATRLPVYCPKQCDRPTWAPGLNQPLLAYTTQGGGGTDIELYDFEAKKARLLTDGQGVNESPSFAPNGKHVLFYTTRWGKKELAIVDIDGKNVRRLTSLGDNTYPSWSRSPK